MKYIDFEKNAAAVENERYETRLDRAKTKIGEYMHKNRVHVFDKKKHKEVATVDEGEQSVLYQDLGLPVQLTEMINDYAKTPVDKRGTEEIDDDDDNINIQK